jgi:hypothetical protein
VEGGTMPTASLEQVDDKLERVALSKCAASANA